MATTELVLRVPDIAQPARVEVTDPETERTLRALAASEAGERVSLAAADDVEGHTASSDVATVRLIGPSDDDTEGHVISLRFPNASDAAQFRRNLAAGILVGSLTIAGAGAAAAGLSTFAQGVDATGAGISNLQPNVHADQAMPALGVSNVQPNVHADQAMPPLGVSNVQPNVHADQAMPAVPTTDEDERRNINALPPGRE